MENIDTTSLLVRKVKERDVINSLHAIYSFYPEYYEILSEYDDLNSAKIVKNENDEKNMLKAAIATVSAAVVTNIFGLDFDLNPDSLLIMSGVTAFGGYAFCKAEGENFPKIEMDKAQQKELLDEFVNASAKFDDLLGDYLVSICDYIATSNDNNELDWNSELRHLMASNATYINEQKDKGIFVSNFNVRDVISFHNEIFDQDRINEVLLTLKDEFLSEKKNVKKRKK